MRLVSSVKRLEGAARARAHVPAEYGIVWTQHDARVDADELREGEYIAVDVTIAEPEGRAAASWRIAERVTAHADDLGLFFNADGARIGRVVSIDPDLVRYELDADPGVGLSFVPGSDQRDLYTPPAVDAPVDATTAARNWLDTV